LVKLRLGGTDRATQVPSDFAVRQTFHVVQQEDCAIAVRQLPEGASDGDPIHGAGKLLILYRKQIQKRCFPSMLAARPKLDRHWAMTIGTQAHQHYVYGQPVQPSR
jgi:hypothetical protein